MLDFQALSPVTIFPFPFEEENPMPYHASRSSSSFMETYRHFPAWKYEVMNPDGSYSYMTLERLEHTPNVPWPDAVCSRIFKFLDFISFGSLSCS